MTPACPCLVPKSSSARDTPLPPFRAYLTSLGHPRTNFRTADVWSLGSYITAISVLLTYLV